MDINFEKRIVAHRRELHKRAEVGFELPQTQRYILDTLISSGYAPKVIGKGSIVAQIGEGCKEYVLLRADIDALNIREETGLPFASTSGRMHACGHDMHAAMLLGAAELLAESNDRPSVGVLLLFQAGEELLEGAADVISTGIFDEFNIICSFTVHVLCGIPFKSGTIILPPHGVVAPGADVIKITVRGKSAHGSTPHIGKSSIYPAIGIINAINTVLSQEIAPTELRLLNWGKIDGGTASNVVAETTELNGNFRSYEKDVRDYVLNRSKTICEHMGKAYGCSAELELLGGCPPLKNDEGLLSAIRDNIEKEFSGVIDGKALESASLRDSLGGSEDFAHFASRVPSVLFSICAGQKEDGYNEPLHNSRTDFDENALTSGARLLAKLPCFVKKCLRS